MRFNVNHEVRVKLTERGRSILREQHGALMPKGIRELYPYREPKEDGEGWSTWQLHALMHHFGPYMTIGFNPPFETEIDIPRQVKIETEPPFVLGPAD